MAQLETWIRQDLKMPLQVQYLSGTMFSQDNAANLVGVEVFDDGEPATLGGSVSANVVRSDGGTVTVSGGTLSGNKVSVVLPQAAYAIPGAISIIIKLTTSGTVTTLGAIVVNVYRSSTDAVVDPGTIIPSVQTLIAQIETAVASIPADYSSLWTSLAPAFSTSTAYTAGQYVTYNGHVYRFTADHAAGSFVNTDCTQVDVGGELSALKSTINEAVQRFNIVDFANGLAGWSVKNSTTASISGILQRSDNSIALTNIAIKANTNYSLYSFQSGSKSDSLPTGVRICLFDADGNNTGFNQWFTGGNFTTPVNAVLMAISTANTENHWSSLVLCESSFPVLRYYGYSDLKYGKINQDIYDLDEKISSVEDSANSRFDDVDDDINGLTNKIETIADPVNLLDFSNGLNGWALKNSTTASMNDILQRSDSNIALRGISVEPNTTYAVYSNITGIISKALPTGIKICEFDSEGNNNGVNIWFTGGTFTTGANTHQLALSTANTEENYKNLMMCVSSFDVLRFYDVNDLKYGKINQDIYDLNDKIEKKSIKAKILSCPYVKSVGNTYDFTSAVLDSNMQLSESNSVKFAKKSIIASGVNSGDSYFHIPVNETNWDSISIACFVPYESFIIDGSRSGYFHVYLNGMGNSYPHTHLNGRVSYGWNVVKLTRNMFAGAPDTLTALYFKNNARNTVASGAAYGSTVFDSVIFNVRATPIIVLNYDQWWQESVDNGAYAYQFASGLPATIMTKNYDTLSADFKALAIEAEQMHGWENGYYASKGVSNTNFTTNISTYTQALTDARAMDDDFAAVFKRKPVSWGSSRNLMGPPMAVDALTECGYEFIRWSGFPPFGYIDDTMHQCSTIGFTYDEIPTFAGIKSEIDKIVQYGSIGMLFTHGVCDDEYTKMDHGTTSGGTQITTFKSMIDYLKTLSDSGTIKVMTMHDVWRGLSK